MNHSGSFVFSVLASLAMLLICVASPAAGSGELDGQARRMAQPVHEMGPEARRHVLDDEHRRLMEVLAEPSLQETASLRLEGWTNEEIAGKLGITRRTVERKLQRIRLIWSVELAKIDDRHMVPGAPR